MKKVTIKTPTKTFASHSYISANGTEYLHAKALQHLHKRQSKLSWREKTPEVIFPHQNPSVDTKHIKQTQNQTNTNQFIN